MPQYRRGVEAVEEAAARKGGKGFRPFVPQVRWSADDEKKYVLVLTPADEVGTFDLHEWIPVGKGEKANGESYTQWETFLSRKDPFIGEDYDKISDDLDRAPKTRCVGVAVELEPVIENVKGRMRPTSFTVKLDTYTRKTDDGEEEVTQPAIGLITQSSQLMWSPLVSYDASVGPLAELPIEITRRGTDANTRYDFVPFTDIPVDVSAVTEYVDGISYLSDDLDDIVAAIEAADGDELAAAQVVAESLFNKRLAELADPDRYEELVGPLTELPDRFGGKKKASPPKRNPRPARTSQREAAEESEEAKPEPVAAKPDRFAELKAQVESRQE